MKVAIIILFLCSSVGLFATISNRSIEDLKSEADLILKAKVLNIEITKTLSKKIGMCDSRVLIEYRDVDNEVKNIIVLKYYYVEDSKYTFLNLKEGDVYTFFLKKLSSNEYRITSQFKDKVSGNILALP